MPNGWLEPRINFSSNEYRCALANEFSQLPIRSKPQQQQQRGGGDKGKKDDIPEIQVDTPFEPTVIYKMLNGIRSDIFQIEGRQEDAEEFLGCVLNRLNDEMIEVCERQTDNFVIFV